MNGRLIEVGSISIDGSRYRMVRTAAGEGSSRAWERTYQDEPPWGGGPPAEVSMPTRSWHSGGLRSREAGDWSAYYSQFVSIRASTEYGQNTDCRFPSRLLPAPKMVSVELLDSVSTPTSLFEALGQLFVVAGQSVYRVDPSDGNVTLSKNFGPGVVAIMGLRWEEDYGLVTTDAGSQSLWKVSALGSPDSWVQTSDVVAYRLAAGVDRLYKVSKGGFLKNVSTGLDPMMEDNYADNVQCGKASNLPTGLVAYARTVFVGKPEALYGIDETGVARPLVSRMMEDSDNCFGMAPADPWVLVPHSRGMYRMVPGRVESVGLEKEALNESPVRGRIRAVATDGRWILASLWTGTDTYILVARDAESEDDSLGPLVWDTWLHLPGETCDVLYVSSLTSPPRLWFGHGSDLAYIELTTGAGAPDPLGSGYKFAQSGNRYFSRYSFGDWGSKAFNKVLAVGRGCTATTYWTIAYSVDGGNFSGQDAGGNEMRVDADGLHTFTLPATAVGREIQLRATYVGASEDAAAELVYLEPFAVPQSRKMPVVSVQLLLSGGLHDETGEPRSALDQMNDLQVLAEQASPVDVEAPWLSGGKAWVRKVRVAEAHQEGDREPELVVVASLQERES